MSNKEYQATRKAAEKALKQRNEFYQHLVVYVLVNIMLVAAFQWQFWTPFVIFGWGIGLVSDAIETFGNDPRRKERAIQRQMEKMGYTVSPDMYEDEKPKRNKDVRLSDDGELVYLDETIEEEMPKRKANSK